MRAFHCTVGLVLLALVCTAAAQAPTQAQPAATAFTVFLKGVPVGTVEVSVDQGATGTVISGISRLGPPFSLAVRSVEIRYDSDWKPIEYTLDAVVRDQITRVHTVFTGGQAASEITQVDTTTQKSDAVAADTVVLSNAFYGAYEALAARLVPAKPGTVLRGYVVPQAEVAITVTGVTDETIKVPGRAVATRHYQATFAVPAGPIEIELWGDLDGRLVRFSVPAQSLDVVRTDIATVAARREVAIRPGDEAVSLPANGFVLGATLSKPADAAKAGSVKWPAVLLVGGSLSTDRDETIANVPIFAQIAGALADAGFLVVRYDKRGIGQSGGRIEAATLSDYADDADAVVRYLAKRKDVDRKRIAVVAHGDGVWTALLAASRDDRIAALALIAGAGTSGVDLTLERQQRALDRMVVPDAEKQTKIDLQRRIHRAVITGTGWQGIPADVRKQAETPWFQSYLLFDPAKVMPRVKQPVLLVRGALDTQVSAAQHERLVSLARSRKGAAGKAVQERTFTGLNHLLVPATTGDVEEYASLKDRTLSGEPMEALAAWLRSTFAAFGKK